MLSDLAKLMGRGKVERERPAAGPPAPPQTPPVTLQNLINSLTRHKCP